MRVLRSLALVGFIGLASLAGTGCKKAMVTADQIEKSAAAITTQYDHGTGAWIIGADGSVSALLHGEDGKPMPGVVGQVSFEQDGKTKTVPATYNEKTGVLTATGPKLDADLNHVTYALVADGKPIDGAIDVPRGGTQDLVETAKLQTTIPEDKTVGPNGGVVQVVGPDRVEVVANRETGEVRAYVLDADYHVVDPGDRKITLAFEGHDPEVVVLTPAPKGRFVVGHVRTRVDPVHVTVAVNVHGATHACLVGWVPGKVVVVGHKAPRVHVFVVAQPVWDEDGVVVLHGHHHGHGVVVGAPGVVVGAPGIVVGAPGVVVHEPGHVHLDVHEHVHFGGGGHHHH